MDYNQDRLSGLPDELIYQILSGIDNKYVVQTCLLSSRWKLLWTSMSCLSFSTLHFASLHKFARFVTHVLARRNHQIKASYVKLTFQGAASPVFMNIISKYAFSHNVQEITVSSLLSNHHEFLNNLFNTPLTKKRHFSSRFFAPCHTPKTPWDFLALTTLHLTLSQIKLCDRKKSVDIFSKCVNLKNITLKTFDIEATEVFNIITPQLSDLTLIDGTCSDVINVIAPQLEQLTIIDCSVKNLNVSPGLSSLCYKGCHPTWLSKHRFYSLNKVTINLSICCLNMPYKKEDALETVKTLQALHCARYLKLNTDILECISSFPDLLLHVPSSFSNLISLTIDSDKRRDAYKVKMSTEVRNFFLGNSPSATLLKEPPTKLMIEKEVREDNVTALVASIDDHLLKMKASFKPEDISSRRQIIDKLAKELLRTLWQNC
ncbi:F-box domain, cyclin-like protein, partial [Tanacetum coccineum]